MTKYSPGTLLKAKRYLEVDNLNSDDTEHNEGEYFIVINDKYFWNDEVCCTILSQKTKTISPWDTITMGDCFMIEKIYGK